MENEISILATTCVRQAISDALNNVKQISSIDRTLKPNVLQRCRSSSNNRNRRRKVSFHNTLPRCSLPATTNDLLHYQTYCRSLRNVHNNRSTRKPSVQYSFSLNKPHVTKISHQRQNLNEIKNFAEQFVQGTVQIALLQIDHEQSCLIANKFSYNLPLEYLQTIHSYADRFIKVTIEQAIERVSLIEIELFSSRFTEDVIRDALAIVTNYEIESRSLFNDHHLNTTQLEINTQRPIPLCHQSGYYSSSPILRSLAHNSSSQPESINALVNNVAVRIYTDSFYHLRRVFSCDHDN